MLAFVHQHFVQIITVHLLYKMHQISKLKRFSSRLVIVFAKYIEAKCWVENEDVIGEAPTGDAPPTS